MHRFFDLPSLNVIWRVMCGRRFDYDDDQMLEMIEHIEAFTMERFIGPIVVKAVYKSVKQHMNVFKSYLSDVVEEGKSDFKEDDFDNGVNYMSSYFSQQSNQSRKFFSDKQLVISMQVSSYQCFCLERDFGINKFCL